MEKHSYAIITSKRKLPIITSKEHFWLSKYYQSELLRASIVEAYSKPRQVSKWSFLQKKVECF